MKCNNSTNFLLFSIIILIIFTLLIILDLSDIFNSNFDFNCNKQQLYNFLIIVGTSVSILIVSSLLLNRHIYSKNLLYKYNKSLYLKYKKSSVITLLWQLSHFTLAFLIGIFAPCYWKEIIWLQTFWEIIECSNWTQSFLKRIWKLNQNSCFTSCGLWKDLFANSLGIIIGLICRKYIL